MGNCQAAEAAAAVVIHHPPGGAGTVGGRVERAHGALSAAAVMAANPGHYVASVIPAAPRASHHQVRAAKRRLKLLRPDDTLALGGVYRLVSFEEVLKEFVSSRRATLTTRIVVLAADDGDYQPDVDCALAKDPLPCRFQEEPPSDPTTDDHRPAISAETNFGAADVMMLGNRFGLTRRHGQWRPALPSIAEGSATC
ncbi:hypothetical protein ACP70R_021444 [Stipagrostis hirtigluma subsp. patula]